jgi:cyclase
MQKVTDNVMVFFGTRGANVGLIQTSEGLVMIESPMLPADSLKLKAEMAGLGTIRYLINTEPHHDHFGGNYYFEGTVIGHEGTREAILKTPLDQFKSMLQMSDPGIAFPADFHLKPPTITFNHRMTIHLGNLTLNLINLPGHTPFETAVYIPEERVVFTGDNVVNGTMPFLHQAVPYAWLDSLVKIGQLEVDYIVPGHGQVCSKSYLGEMTATVSAWIEAVKEALARGWSLEETQSRVDLIDRYPGDKQRMARTQKMNIENLYHVLSQK